MEDDLSLVTIKVLLLGKYAGTRMLKALTAFVFSEL
jgi:hypothetical protein